MNHKLISGLTATLLFSTATGVILSSDAGSTPAVNPGSQADSSAYQPTSPKPRSSTVVKMGEQQTPNAPKQEVIAEIHSHEQSGRKAATVYIRNIPVLTFVGPQRNSSDAVKLGEVQTDNPQVAKLKVGSDNTRAEATTETRQHSQNSSDPIARATAIAAKLNQLHRDGLDANAITVKWKSEERYVVEANKRQIVSIDANTLLPGKTQGSEQDALQITNRLRRLVGNAKPLREVQNKPKAPDSQEIALGPIRVRLSGMASWYGPGFHGNTAASGEIFDENAMTAAHKSLPFGTRVKVTNKDNGRSVIVRINDRGPYSGGRIIDLSAGAADVIGLTNSGVAPVSVDVIGSR
jgi:rare lipoprotein A